MTPPRSPAYQEGLPKETLSERLRAGSTRVVRAFRVFAAAVGIAVSAAACTPATTQSASLQYTENAKVAYDEALEAYFDQDWEGAVLLFEEVKRKYGYSRYARLAQLRIADAAYRQEKFPEAVTEYKSFLNDYPNDPEVPYARYKVIKANFEQSGEAVLLPPLEERDLTNVMEAYERIRTFLQDYPDYKHNRELRYMLEVVTGTLARHELYVARFYLDEENFEAAVARAQYAIANYGDSGLTPEALVLLGETYLKMKKRKAARAVFQRVLAKHSHSAFVIPARKFLRHMDGK